MSAHVRWLENERAHAAWRGFAGVVMGLGFAEPLPPDTARVPASGRIFYRSETIKIPSMRLRRDAAGRLQTLQQDEIHAELVRLTGVEFAKSESGPWADEPYIDYRAAEYAVVDHRWFTKVVFQLWLELEYWKLTYAPDCWDCDEHCLALGALADIARLRSPDQRRTPPALFGMMIVQTVHRRGGSDGGTHALVIFRSERSWWVVDPQSRRAEPLEKFRSRGGIREILFR